MALDRAIALFFLILSVVYAYAAYHYPLLPFERNMPFLPNTLPIALGGLGALVSLIIMVAPRPADSDAPPIDMATVRQFHLGQTLALVAIMVAYALALRPVGFLFATFIFISGSAMILGERNFKLLLPIAAFASGSVWYLVQETLGIFLRPWPAVLD
ncbi:MAG: tripartite tricarboxylate transporter TctB family protein [Pseudomonadota bacterium]